MGKLLSIWAKTAAHIHYVDCINSGTIIALKLFCQSFNIRSSYSEKRQSCSCSGQRLNMIRCGLVQLCEENVNNSQILCFSSVVWCWLILISLWPSWIGLTLKGNQVSYLKLVQWLTIICYKADFYTDTFNTDPAQFVKGEGAGFYAL